MSEPPVKARDRAEIARAVMSGKVKASAVVEAALTRIEAGEPTVNAFTDVVWPSARASARPRSMPAGIAAR